MQKKIFWLTLTLLSLIVDLSVSLWWGVALTIPIVMLSWWVAYRSGWFE